MSLSSAFSAIFAGCVSVPQTGFAAVESPAKYQFTYMRGYQRVFYRFNFPVTLVWDCPSPPATIRMSFYENYADQPDTDPLFHCDGFIGDCASPGTSLGTSQWYQVVSLNVSFTNRTPVLISWIHFQNWKSNEGSVGLIKWPDWPPVWRHE